MKLRYAHVKVRIESSPPSRGAWIEICTLSLIKTLKLVAPLAGGVD